MGLISIFFLTTPLIFAIGVVICIIITMKKNQQGKPLKITSHTLVQFYLYLISLITLVVLVIGAGLTSKVLLSYKVSIPFSYSLMKANQKEDMPKFEAEEMEEFKECYQGETIQFYGENFCFDSTQRKTELITGITLILSMTILFALHQFGISKIKNEDMNLWIKKAYTFLSLLIYSLMGIITIPLSTYLLTNFFLFEPPTELYSTPSAPAMTCTVMIVSIPLWIYFLKKTIQLKEK